MKADTIAAIATPAGMGAVSLIRVSGPSARAVTEPLLRTSSPRAWEARRQCRAVFQGDDGDAIDDVLFSFFPGPGSFTGEDLVEISGHGGIVVTGKILSTLLTAGARAAEAGEFSERAFLNGKMDLTQAEAIMDLISAQTDLAARAAREQLEGGLGGETESIREAIIAVLAHLEAFIDFPDEDIDPDTTDELGLRIRDCMEKVVALIGTAERGRILREGIRTVIFGAPNAGKSSFLNLLLGFDRAIVSEIAGTTRDTIEE
ncbi:MAG: GTPase, partial [Verrucomicrobiota bacterium]